MAISMIKKLFCLCLFLLASMAAFSQSYEDIDYRRLSITVSGGSSLGDSNNGDYFMSSNFSVNTKYTPAFGVGMQYALTPAWSLDLGYRRTQVEGAEIPFETSLNLITFKNIVNLNQLFFVNRISNRLNPFLSAGAGYDIYQFDGPDEEFNRRNFSYNAGAGIAYRLNNTIDLFTHYEFHLGSNAMDNETEGWGADLINSLTGGIRINLGKKGSTHPSWREVPVEISPADYQRFNSQEMLIADLQNEVNELEERNRENKRHYEQKSNEQSAEIDSLRMRVNQLERQVAGLEDSLASNKNAVQEITGSGEGLASSSLPAGHYVQIFASHRQSNAEYVRDSAQQRLDEVLAQSSPNTFIIKRKIFYEVMIGDFSEFEQAGNVQGIMSELHDDAFVITFPRPVNLQPDFEGLQVLN